MKFQPERLIQLTNTLNKNKEEAVVEALLPSLDTFEHSEERRLLYVGITRAKKKSYLIDLRYV